MAEIIFNELLDLLQEAHEAQAIVRLDRRYLTSHSSGVSTTVAKIVVTAHVPERQEILVWGKTVGRYEKISGSLFSHPPYDPESVSNLLTYFIGGLEAEMVSVYTRVELGSMAHVPIELLNSLNGEQHFIKEPTLKKGEVWKDTEAEG